MSENTEVNESTESTEQATPSWYYSAPTEDNSGVGGSGEAPEWLKVDKYKSVEEQAKAYPELASRFGGFEKAPEQYELPQGVEPEMFDEGILEIVKSIGKENQMGQNMFNQLVSQVAEYQTKQHEQTQAQAMEKLGEKAQERIQNVNNWLNTNAPKEIIDMVVPMGNSAEAIQALEWFINKSKSSNVANNDAQIPTALTESEFAEQLMAKDAHGNLKISVDPEYKKKMDELTAQRQRR